jgi:Plasmid pRiA4b ORF-3-like protein
MARAKRSITPVVYQIKVTLKGSKPPIWRRMQVSSATTLAQLHHILQRVMGWEGSHLYRFVVGRIEYGDPSMLEEMEGEDARRVTLATLVRGEKDKVLYEYDFGDSWDHELLIEKVLPLEAGKRYPVVPHGQTRLSA